MYNSLRDQLGDEIPILELVNSKEEIVTPYEDLDNLKDQLGASNIIS